MIKFMEAPLVRALLDEAIPFSDIMNSFNIQTHVAFNLSSACQGFVYYSSGADVYLIVLNGNFNYETQCRAFAHEVAHIVMHMPKEGYYIGINKQYSSIEIYSDNIKL